jgi:hypothetical protein
MTAFRPFRQGRNSTTQQSWSPSATIWGTQYHVTFSYTLGRSKCPLPPPNWTHVWCLSVRSASASLTGQTTDDQRIISLRLHDLWHRLGGNNGQPFLNSSTQQWKHKSVTSQQKSDVVTMQLPAPRVYSLRAKLCLSMLCSHIAGWRHGSTDSACVPDIDNRLRGE